MPPVDGIETELEYLWPRLDTPRIELSLDGEVERRLSGVGHERSSGSVELSLDKPGSLRLPTVDVIFESCS